MDDGDWTELSRRAGVASHRLVGWIYWDPVAVENYAALGVPDGIGYYIASRGALLGEAGNAVVNAEGIAFREGLEDRLDRICVAAWQALGEEGTRRFLDLVEPVGPILMARVDETAGPNWMPAGRDRRA